MLSPVSTGDGGKTASMEFESSTTLLPGELHFALQAKASTPNINQRIELFDASQGVWTTVDSRIIGRSESRAEIEILHGIQYADSVTRKVKARVVWATPGNSGNLLRVPWTISLNQAVWRILP